MFGTNSIFQMPAPEGLFGHSSSFVSYVFLISIVVFGLSLLFAAITDQKLLKLYTAKRVLFGADILTSAGTFAVFAAHAARGTRHSGHRVRRRVHGHRIGVAAAVLGHRLLAS